MLITEYSDSFVLTVVFCVGFRGGSEAKLWSSSRLVAQGIHDNSVLDGLHISKSALQLVSLLSSFGLIV